MQKRPQLVHAPDDDDERERDEHEAGHAVQQQAQREEAIERGENAGSRKMGDPSRKARALMNSGSF